MERETKEFITPNGIKIILKTYFNGREANEIKSKLFGDVEFETNSENGKIEASKTKLDYGMIVRREKSILENAVVSVDGKIENVIELINDLKLNDYSALVLEVSKLAEGNF